MTKAMPSEVKGILCFCREVVPVYLNRTSAKKERPKSIDIKTVNAITRLLDKERVQYAKSKEQFVEVQ